MEQVTISASDVNKLRLQTGAGLMDCKKALIESHGDFEQAIVYLRKKGQKVSASRAGRVAKEGVIIAMTSPDSKFGVIVQLSCETDFVAKNKDFIAFATSVAKLALDKRPASTEELLNLDLDGLPVRERVVEQVGKIGEKIEVAAYETLSGESVVPYIHAGNRLGVLAALNKPASPAITEAGKDAAMQVAALNPVAADEHSVSKEIIDRELEIGREQARNEGKPAEMVDRIAEGKLKKFYKESTLMQQPYVKDASKTVGQRLAEADKELRVVAFKRVALG
jgi:elongation factor Ts